MDPKLVKTFKELGDLYKVLHIEPTDDKKAIEKAFRKQALIWHPDKNKSAAAPEMFHKAKKAHEILLNEDLKTQFDLYKKNQKYHEERSSKQNKERRKFADDLVAKEKAHQKGSEEQKDKKKSKEEQKREDGKRMKREWEEEEQRRKEEYEKNSKKAEKVESKEFTMIKVKWPKSNGMSYSEEMLKMIFGKYGEIKGVVIFPSHQKALIEYQYRLSAEKAYKENKKSEKEKMGFDDGLKVSLLVKNKEDQKPRPDEPHKVLVMDSRNIEKISNVMNRNSTTLIGSIEDEIKRSKERQRLIDEILAKEGLA